MKIFKKGLNTFVKPMLIGLTAGFANGMFGSGGGTIAVPAMVHLMDMEEHKAHATAIAIILPLTLISSVLYIRNGWVNWPLTLQMTLGGMVGGYIGAKLLGKCSENVLRKIFGIFMIFAALRMVFS